MLHLCIECAFGTKITTLVLIRWYLVPIGFVFSGVFYVYVCGKKKGGGLFQMPTFTHSS